MGAISVGAPPAGKRDRVFLARAFQKLMRNFTWWVNRKDVHGDNVFSGGFLGLDNIGVFDRSQTLPTGGHLEQADGTAWMAFFCSTMLSMALELAREDPVYDDVASKFFEHFIAIADAWRRRNSACSWSPQGYLHVVRNSSTTPHGDASSDADTGRVDSRQRRFHEDDYSAVPVRPPGSDRGPDDRGRPGLGLGVCPIFAESDILRIR